MERLDDRSDCGDSDGAGRLRMVRSFASEEGSSRAMSAHGKSRFGRGE